MNKTIAAQTLESFRNNVDYAENEALIIMIDIRKKGEKPVYLDMSDKWVQEEEINYIEYVSDALNVEYEDYEQYYVTYKVGFEGDVWEKVDELNKDEKVVNIEI